MYQVLPFKKQNSFVLTSASSTRGMTLIEVMFSMFILAVVLLGIFGSINQSFHLAGAQKDYQVATQILQHEVDSIRLLPWDDVEDLSSSTSAYTTDNGLEAILPGKYQINRSVAELNSGKQKEVVHELTWIDIQGQVKSLSYYSKFTEDGLNTLMRQ